MNKREDWIEKGFSEEQTTDVLNEFHSLNKQITDLQKELENSKVQGKRVEELEKQLDEINKSKMTEQEKIDANLRESEEIKRKAQIALNTANAKNILAGYDVGDEILESIVVGDEQTAINKATLLKAKFDTLKDNTTKQVKEELSNLNAKPNPSNVLNQDDSMTIEKFSKMTMLEQKKWKDEHLDEYHEMYSKK
jgi:hypothetical protein